MIYKVSIEDLRVKTVIGINPNERIEKQEVSINVDIWSDLSKSVITDSINDTIDYKVIKKEIISYVENSSFNLLETLTYKIGKVVEFPPLLLSKYIQYRVLFLPIDKPTFFQFFPYQSELHQQLVIFHIYQLSPLVLLRNPSGVLRNLLPLVLVLQVYLLRRFPDSLDSIMHILLSLIRHLGNL
ncbi:hypothetical protein DJ528_10955 [Sulfolobus sp. B5]|nr:hypothetical protein DJ528_10955 [Sulfolobus sp. B5]